MKACQQGLTTGTGPQAAVVLEGPLSTHILFSYLSGPLCTHSSTLAWRILWTEEPGGLLSMGSHRVRHD